MFIGVPLEDTCILLTHSVAQKEKRLRNFSLSRCFHWWAHQDLNLGPKDYESRSPRQSHINRGSEGGQSRCVSKCVSKFVDLKKVISRSLVFITKGYLEQPSNTSLLQSTFWSLSVTLSNAYLEENLLLLFEVVAKLIFVTPLVWAKAMISATRP